MRVNEIDKVVEDRGKNYGDPGPRFEAVQNIYSAWEKFLDANHPRLHDTPEIKRLKHVAYMCCDKMTRLAVTPDHADSFVDIAGYARCGENASKG